MYHTSLYTHQEFIPSSQQHAIISKKSTSELVWPSGKALGW